MTKSNVIIVRMGLSLLTGLLVAGLISEISFRTQANLSRAPGMVDLIIPAGAAEKTSRGISLIPEGMTFVEGDVLMVINQDDVTHTLGEMFIPAGSTTTLTLNRPGNLALNCSFRPNHTFGLDVREALTWNTRLQGILLAGLPLAILLGLYSLVAWPLDLRKESP